MCFLILYTKQYIEAYTDDIPNVLKEFGLRYTKQYGDKIYDLIGSRPHIVKKQKVKFEKDENFVDKEEIELKVVQEDAENYLMASLSSGV
jgi:hypothetical protein